MAQRGRPAPICPDTYKLRAMVERGCMQAELAREFKKPTKTIKKWLIKHGLALHSVIPDVPGEQWRPVLGWEGFYEVSSEGRVKSLSRLAFDGTPIQGKLRQPAMQGRGNPYWQVHLFRGGRGSSVYRVAVHRLVLESFVGPCPPGMEACHINGNGFDNRAVNLRWDTHEENMRDQSRYEKLPICPCCGQQFDGKLNLKPRSARRFNGELDTGDSNA